MHRQSLTSPQFKVMAVFGSIEVPGNSSAAIEAAVRLLLDGLVGEPAGDLTSCVLASSPELDADFPATAARRWGVDCPVLSLVAASTEPRRIEMVVHRRVD